MQNGQSGHSLQCDKCRSEARSGSLPHRSAGQTLIGQTDGGKADKTPFRCGCAGVRISEQY